MRVYCFREGQEGVDTTPTCLCYNPDTQVIYTGDNEGNLTLFDIRQVCVFGGV